MFNSSKMSKIMIVVCPDLMGAGLVVSNSLPRPPLGVALSRSKVKRTTPTSFVKGEN
jgi:hypothetical protein